MGCGSSAARRSSVRPVGADVQRHQPPSPRRSSVLPVGADVQRQRLPSLRRSFVLPGGADVQRQEPPSPKGAAREWSLTLSRSEDDVLGAALGDSDKGAVIMNIQQGGLLDVWNKANLAQRLYPGFIITEVNGVRGYWGILEELWRPGELELKISDQPPARAGPTWFEYIATMGRSLEQQEDSVGDGSEFILRLRMEGPNAAAGQYANLPNVVAGDCGVDQCAICLDDVAPDETLVQLRCKHAFHAACAARWLTQSQGKRQCCPLCCQTELWSPENVFSLEEECAGAAGVAPQAGGGTPAAPPRPTS